MRQQHNFFEFIVECGTRNISITKSCDDFFVAVRERKKREAKESNQRKIRDKKEREITQNNFVVYRFKIIKRKVIYIDFLLFFCFILLIIFAIDLRFKLNERSELCLSQRISEFMLSLLKITSLFIV